MLFLRPAPMNAVTFFMADLHNLSMPNLLVTPGGMEHSYVEMSVRGVTRLTGLRLNAGCGSSPSFHQHGVNACNGDLTPTTQRTSKIVCLQHLPRPLPQTP
ncbi:hypothetical protein SBA1_1290004 [Candidatus Sulfotelmatobacter kueseliae]|uniref:Uncharacterized protein n=1 Tax=Candidatus Sulfotelmatobacter kueseliae TaxID=2042962 RepID=A0A2U3K4P1_9BACT|nr:hypothetical protein SBA1_1290004 [Candidatus Sulfotelmatobacter kueseliae]